MESLIRDKIMEHLETGEALPDKAIPARIHVGEVQVYMESLTKLMAEGHAVDVLYLDFAKAFDKVPH